MISYIYENADPDYCPFDSHHSFTSEKKYFDMEVDKEEVINQIRKISKPTCKQYWDVIILISI